MESGFSERQYEHFLNLALCNGDCVFIPTQHSENTLGVDATVMSFNRSLWRFFGIPRIGVELTRELWEGVEHDINRINLPDSFHVNLFIQYKRPEFIKTRRGAEYCWWQRPYYRYNIDQNQNASLVTLERNLGNWGLVIYACPATIRLNELIEFARGKTLIENSNFVRPSVLLNHSKNTFVSGGTCCMAFSEPEEIPALDLNKEIDKLGKIPKKHPKNSDFIKELSDIIDKSVKESDNVIKRRYLDVFDLLGKSYENKVHDETNLAVSFARIHSFLLVTGLSWKII